MIRSSLSLLSALKTLTYLVPSVQAAYTLQDNYSPDKFLDMFDFFTGVDPTNGYVNYIDEVDAQVLGLVNTYNNQVYMGVDHNTIAQAPGRSSVRLSSKNTYNHGLIILDLEHMPGGICGTWPAFWLLGPNWPDSGEVDIIEGVNSASTNQMTLHTNTGCTITNNGLSSGSILGSNCDVTATDNAGCSIATSNTQTYGSGFNANNGGVYVTEWTSEAISIWFFPRNAIPSDITAGTPDPANWGLALAQFSGGCDIDEHVVNQQIVFDTTFCGDWAGEVWSTDPVCSQKASTCVDYVMNNPSDFTDAYWSINSLQVFQNNGAAVSSGALTVTSTSYTATATVPTTSAPTTAFPTTLTTSTWFVNTYFTPSPSISFVTSSFSATFFTVTTSTPTGFNYPSSAAPTSTPTGFSNPSFATPTSTPTGFSNPSFATPTSTPTGFGNPSFATPTSTPTGFSNSFFTGPQSPPTGFSNPFFTAPSLLPAGFSNSFFTAPESTPTGFNNPFFTAPTSPSIGFGNPFFGRPT